MMRKKILVWALAMGCVAGTSALAVVAMASSELVHCVVQSIAGGKVVLNCGAEEGKTLETGAKVTVKTKNTVKKQIVGC